MSAAAAAAVPPQHLDVTAVGAIMGAPLGAPLVALPHGVTSALLLDGGHAWLCRFDDRGRGALLRSRYVYSFSPPLAAPCAFSAVVDADKCGVVLTGALVLGGRVVPDLLPLHRHRRLVEWARRDASVAALWPLNGFRVAVAEPT